MKKNNKTLKRFLAFLLCAAMLITYMPSSVYTLADESTDTPEVAADADSGDSGAEAKKEAPKKAPAPEAAPAEQAEPAPAAEPETAAEPEEGQVEEAKESDTPETRAGPSEDSEAAAEEATEETSEEAAPEGEEAVEEEAVEEEKEDEEKLNEKELTFTGKANSVNVKVVAQPGTFPEGTTMKVVSVAKNDVKDAVEGALDDVNDFRAVDITFYADGKEVQPKKNVSVKLTTYAFDSEEDLSVVHVKDSGNAEVMGLSSATDTAAQFKSDSFSVYVVVETGEDARLKVVFHKVDGTTAEMLINKRQISHINQYIYDPGYGTPGEGVQFKGWTTKQNYTADDVENAMTIADVRTEVTNKLNATSGVTDGDVFDVYAMGFKTYTVTFQDERGIMVKTDQVLVNATSSETPKYTVELDYTPYPTGEEGVVAEFMGWQQIKPEISGELKLYQIGESVDLTETEFVLKAYTEEGHWLVFEENLSNASYTEPQFVAIGKKPTVPADPTRSGYTFDGWYTEDDSEARNGKVKGSEFNFDSVLTENTVVYGKWTPASTANYKVVFWLENKEGTGYDYSGTTLTVSGATVGNNTYNITAIGSGNDRYARVYRSNNNYNNYNDFTGFHLSTVKPNANGYEDPKPVAAEGNTIINVYYDRNMITYNFRYSSSNIRSFTGRYGSDFKDWPDPGNGNVWGIGSGWSRVTFPLPVTEYNPAVVSADNTSTDITFTLSDFDQRYTLYVYKQTEAGEWSYTDDYLIATAPLAGGYQTTWTPTETYIGYTLDSYRRGTTGTWINCTPTTRIEYSSDLYLRYTRDQYKIDYNDGIFEDGSHNPVPGIKETNILPEVTVYYEANIASFNKTPSKDGFVFLGWYDNEDCAGDPYTFDKMPAHNVTLYAKWGIREYEINLHANDSTSDPIKYNRDDQATTFYTDEGTKVGDVGGKRIYSDLVGWYSDEAMTHAFNFDAMVINQATVEKYGKLYAPSQIDPDYPTTVGELNLYAKWRSKLIGAEGIDVVYDAAGGTNAPTDNNKYVDQAEAIAGAASTAEDPDNYVFSHWVVQKWNGTAFEDTNVKVFPGESFDVLAANAKITEKGKDVAVDPSDLDSSKEYTYTVQLKASYIDKDKEVKTFINFYNNYDGGKVKSYTDIKINQAVDIPAAPKRDGYEFKGWIRGIEEKGTTTTETALWLTYENGEYKDKDGNAATQVACDENLVGDGTQHHALYAKWEPHKYTVKFDKNATDATGTMSDQTFDYDEQKKLTANAFERDGYVFVGWNTDKDATTATYTDEQLVKNLTTEANGVVTLYAVWVKEAEVNTGDAAANFAKKKVTGTGFDAKTFAFSIKANGDAPAPAATTASVSFAKNDEVKTKPINFGTLTFDKVGTFTYTVTESTTSDGKDGWTMDNKDHTVTVTVTDNGKGQLVASVSGAEIENSYKASSVDVDTSDAKAKFAKKTVEGTGFNEKTFEFSIAAGEGSPEGTPVPEDATTSVTFAKNDEVKTKPINFGTLTFDKAGTYTYTVTETTTSDGKDGWTMDNEPKTVTVTVTDDGKGQLVAEASDAEINNSYKAAPATVDTTADGSELAKKVVVGTGFDPKTFEFSIEADKDSPEGTPVPEDKTASLDVTEAGTQAVNFGTLTFNEAGTYTYTITETTELDPETGWTAPQGQTKTATVTVTDNGEGELEASVQPAQIQNNYKASEVVVNTADTDAEFVKKTVEGTGFNAKTFNFKITPDKEKQPAPEEGTAELTFDAADTKAVNFGSITFTEAGTYTYTVEETTKATAGDGWTMDNKAKTVTVEVTDNGSGQLEAKVTGAEITNKYKAAPVEVDTDDPKEDEGDAFVTKTVEGTGFKAKAFAFSIAVASDSAENTPVPDPATGSTEEFSAAGNKPVNFGTLTFSKAGIYKYTVQETTENAKGWTLDKEPKTVTVEVTDNGAGQLKAKVTGAKVTNSYKAESVDVDTSKAEAQFAKKTVEGTGFNEKTFAFSIAADKNSPEGTPVPEDATASVTFAKNDEVKTKPIDFGTLTFDKVGTFTYTVTETTTAVDGDGWTIDNKDHTVTVTVTDDSEGQLVAKVSGAEIKNSYKANPEEIDTTEAGAELAKKAVVGTGFNKTSFAFKVEPEKDEAGKTAPAPDKATATLDFEKAGTTAIDFGKIKFTEPGTYKYKVTETTELSKGWEAPQGQTATATVTVTDNGNGKLETSVSTALIQNNYKAGDIVVNTTDTDAEFVKKTVEGTGFNAKTFEFEIVADETAPAVKQKEASLSFSEAGTQAVNFGSITFTEAGTYTYTVKETTEAEEKDGWTMDNAPKTVTVKVTDNGSGQLEAKVTGVEIKNKYEAASVDVDTDNPTGDASGSAFVTKTVSGTGFKAKAFDFSIAAAKDSAENTPVPEPAKGSTEEFSAAGNKPVDFGTLTFSKAGTYKYTVQETTANAKGWTLDKEPKTVTVEVTDNGTGQLKAKVTGAEVTNSYKAESVEVDTDNPKGDASGSAFATKVVEGSGFEAQAFDFTIAADTGSPAVEKTSDSTEKFTKAGSEKLDFGTITFTETGAFTYTVKETTKATKGWTNDTADKTVTVTVTDNGEGQLKAVVTGVTVTNSYKAKSVDVDTDNPTGDASGTPFVTKTVEGTGFDPQKFAFTLEVADGDEAAAMKTATTDEFAAAGSKAVDFGTLTFNEPGTYKYKVQETTKATKGWTNDNKAKEVTVTVTDDGKGQLKAVVSGVEVKNSYKAAPVTVDTEDPEGGDNVTGSPFVTKTVTGTGFKPQAFEFSITAAGKAPKTKSDKASTEQFTEAGSKKVDFGTLTFDEAGTYTYTVKETTEATKGWTNDTSDKTVTVTVTDNGKGQLEAEVSGVTVTNAYAAKGVPVVPSELKTAFVKKTVSGTGFNAQAFDFSIAVAEDSPEGTPVPAEAKASTDTFAAADTKTVNFAPITFTKAGTYKYTVQETTADAKGWTLDKKAKTVTVTITDDGEGQLVAAVDGVTVTNSYKAEPVIVDTDDPIGEDVSGKPFITKTVEGKGFDPQAFSFSITADKGSPAVAEATATTDEFTAEGSKKVDLGSITFTEAGTYTYTVKETTEATKGWKNDTEEKKVTVTVTDDGKGQLKADVAGVEIKNTYKAEPVIVDTDDPTGADVSGKPFITKKVEGKGFDPQAFSFSITAGEGSPAVAKTTASTDAFAAEGSKTVDLGSITFTEVGTYTYTVKETTEATKGWKNDTAEKTVTVTVTDDGKGQLKAKVDGAEITNTYKAEPVTVDTDEPTGEDVSGKPFATKTVEGSGFEAQAFSFSITAGEGAPAVAKATATTDKFAEAGSKAVDFGSITFTEAGTYTYTVKETTEATKGWKNDTAEKTVTVTVTDDGKGQLQAKVDGAEIKNSYKAEPVVVDTDDPTGTDVSGKPFVTKKVEGPGFDPQAFSFSITAGSGSPAVSTGTATTDRFTSEGSKAVNFGKITFTEAGTYTYTVKETTTATSGWANDNAAKTVTVTVTDDGKGQLKAKVDGAEVTNRFTANPAISVTKTANRTRGLRRGDAVTYTITVRNTGNVTLTGINVTDSLVKFKGSKGKNITLAPGATAKLTYNYTVTAANVRAGRVVNTAAAQGSAPDGRTPSDSDSVTARTRANGGGGGNPGGPAPAGPAPGAPAVTPAAPADGAAVVVPEEPVPEAEPEVEIEEPETPLAGGAWALVNLICAILTTVGAIVALFRKKEDDDEDEDEPKTDEEDEDDNRGKKMLASKIAGAVAGVAAPIAFILTEDMTLPMQMVDKWTLLMVVILAAQIVAAIFNKKASELDDEDEEEAGAAAN